MSQFTRSPDPVQANSMPSKGADVPGAPARYVQQVTLMLSDASLGQTTPDLVEAFTWALGLLGARCGPEVTADILHRLARNMASIAAQDRAEREAKQVRQEGRAFQ